MGILKVQVPGLFTARDPPTHPSNKGCEDAAHEAVVNYRKWVAMKSTW